MSNYLVECDGCGKPQTTSCPNDFICDNCGYELCTILEQPKERSKE